MRNKTVICKNFDVVVVGGGLAGVCAAIASSRHGARTALIHNRPVLGGNASSEIRMHICGADCHGTRPDARETGIIEEILLETRHRNPQNSFSILDTVLWEKTTFQDGLDLFLNTHMTDVKIENNAIVRILAEQTTTEKIFEINAGIFIDATGDGTVGWLAGAEFLSGREGKKVFGEQYAPDESDNYTMGSTLLFKSVDVGYPIPFEKPWWANMYKEEDLCYRTHTEFASGYWWIELGGENEDVISDGEKLRDELLKAVYGVWDHIKNSGHHNADNFALDWVGFLPGKRESRRLIGDYILKEQDCFSGRVFEDAVSYGGWPMDMHIVGGLRTRQEPTLFLRLDDVYTIPYRCLYSKNIENLMMAGRNISVSHMAFGSMRVMATCAVIGQAVGTAAAMASELKNSPRDVLKYIDELQQNLLKDDCYIPGYKNMDEKDLGRYAEISSSSSLPGCDAQKVTNGIARKVKEEINCWISDDMGNQGEWLCLDFGKSLSVREIHVKFDSNLSKEIMVSLSHSALIKQIPGIPRELVKDYCIELWRMDEIVHSMFVTDNYLRFRVHRLNEVVTCDKIKITVLSTNGDKHARIFEVRVY